MNRRVSKRLDAVFGALSDPIRRTILARLTQGECSVTALSEPFDVSAPAITKHLHVLESSGLITRRKEGRVNYCALNEASLREADDWIQQQRRFWEQQLDALEKYLKKENGVCGSLSQSGRDEPSGSDACSKRRGKQSSTHGRTPKS
jgi:DNA-binding transcriptional ArsR family regulator